MTNSYLLVLKSISILLLIPTVYSLIREQGKRGINNNGNPFMLALFFSVSGFGILTIVWFLIAYFWGIIIYDPYPNMGPLEEPKPDFSSITTGPRVQEAVEVFLQVIVGIISWVPFEISLLIIATAFLSQILSTEGFAQ